MRILAPLSVIAAAALALAPTVSFAGQKMGPDYHENATSTCRVHVWTRAGGRPVVSFAISQENKGQNLRVLASGGGWTCSCLYRPGDADLYPSVRLVEPPVCSAGK